MKDKAGTNEYTSIPSPSERVQNVWLRLCWANLFHLTQSLLMCQSAAIAAGRLWLEVLSSQRTPMEQALPTLSRWLNENPLPTNRSTNIVGQLVHYTLPSGEHRAAIIESSDTYGQCCDLRVWISDPADEDTPLTQHDLAHLYDVKYSVVSTPGHWHWIERK